MAEVNGKVIEDYNTLIPNQFEDSTLLKSLLDIYLEQALELDQANIDLSNGSTDISTAIGYQLDIIGKLVGVERQGRSDDDYRNAILLQTLINRADATNNSILEVLKVLTDSESTNVFEHFPATAIFKTDNIETDNYTNVSRVIEDVKPAGVDVTLVYQNPEIGNALVLSEQNGDFSSTAILAELGSDVLGVEDGVGIEDLNINATGILEQLEIQDGDSYQTFNNYPVETLETRKFI